MQAAYKKIGIEAVIQHYPPARGIQLANEGNTDGELYRSFRINGKFSNLVMVPVPITHTEVVAFVKNIQFPVKGWDSLKPYRIGVERGFKLAEARTEGMKTQSAKVEQTFQMLDAGRVDVVVSTRLGGSGHVKNLKLKGIKILTPPLEKDMIHHFLHKKHQKIIPELTATLENMKKTGEIDTIKNQVEKTLFE
ncbi:transporter substrate-binding domain-containing protein [Desulfococcaceae bacterium HSG7]|nr:transporter substrate-binding domain-containing protein [Desulfococcaceae bacterium HSG7]